MRTMDASEQKVVFYLFVWKRKMKSKAAALVEVVVVALYIYHAKLLLWLFHIEWLVVCCWNWLFVVDVSFRWFVFFSSRCVRLISSIWLPFYWWLFFTTFSFSMNFMTKFKVHSFYAHNDDGVCVSFHLCNFIIMRISCSLAVWTYSFVLLAIDYG